MFKTKERALLKRFQQDGYPAFQNNDPASNTLSVLVEQTGGPLDSVLMETDAGVVVVLHLKITCTGPELDCNEMWGILQGYEALHFEVLPSTPAELWYPEDELIINQRKTMREGQCNEGLFFARALARLPAGLRHGQTINMQFSMTNHLGDCFSAYFPLWVQNLGRKKRRPTRRNILDELIIYGEKEEPGENE